MGTPNASKKIGGVTLLILDEKWYTPHDALETAIDGNLARERNPALPMFVLTNKHFEKIAEMDLGIFASKIEDGDGNVYWRPEAWLTD